MPTTLRVGIVGCGSAKREHAAPAKDLYTSSYFALKRQFAEEYCDQWYVFSAKHGLVAPDTVLDPYDASLSPRSDAYVGDDPAQDLGAEVRRALRRDVLPPAGDRDVDLVVLAGRDYAQHLAALDDCPGVTVSRPFEGLGGLHGQMEWLSAQVGEAADA